MLVKRFSVLMPHISPTLPRNAFPPLDNGRKTINHLYTVS
ncbi:hypothetical protein DDI_0177 [Dickeya dianthicola RNS04.9]|nr:hypothetical protein DDI_0177 [Dickeya dianthicola RNS04.9]